MKLPRFTRTLLISIIGLFALTAYVPATAHDRKQYPYTLFDVGTLGGPQTYGEFPGTVLNNRGMLALFGSDLPTLDPRHATPSLCFNPDCHLDHAVVWQNGHLTDLGAFPGATSSGVSGISPNGRYVAGLSTDGTLDPAGAVPAFRAALFTQGQVIDLGTFGGTFSGANNVNNRGQVVGVAQNAIPDPFAGDLGFPPSQPTANPFPGSTQERAFLWQQGVLHDLGTLGGNDAEAAFINARGQIAGASFTTTVANPTTNTPTQHPFLWERGTMRDLGSLGGSWGAPSALNDQGQVIGSMNLAGDQTHHAFMWTQGTLTDLGTLGGANSDAWWENAAGHVVGSSNRLGSTFTDAVLWKDGTLIDIAHSRGDQCSRASGINAHDQVVGLASAGACGVGIYGFVWDHGQLTNLNDLVAPLAGWSVLVHAAFYINDQGVIFGAGIRANGDETAIMLVPNNDFK